VAYFKELLQNLLEGHRNVRNIFWIAGLRAKNLIRHLQNGKRAS